MQCSLSNSKVTSDAIGVTIVWKGKVTGWEWFERCKLEVAMLEQTWWIMLAAVDIYKTLANEMVRSDSGQSHVFAKDKGWEGWHIGLDGCDVKVTVLVRAEREDGLLKNTMSKANKSDGIVVTFSQQGKGDRVRNIIWSIGVRLRWYAGKDFFISFRYGIVRHHMINSCPWTWDEALREYAHVLGVSLVGLVCSAFSSRLPVRP
jgi:hypothetical protein